MAIQALVIDDSQGVRMLLRDILVPLGFAVEEAAEGREGLDRLRALDDVQLVLVDWDMPVMDGHRFVSAVRADPAYSRQRLVMVTGQTSIECVRKALAAGVDEYVMKPFDQRVISEKIALLGFRPPA